MSEQPETQTLIWVDLETTGLDPSTDDVLEIAAVVTDTGLVGGDDQRDVFHALVSWDGDVEQLDEWVRNTHTETGLLGEVTGGCDGSVPLERADHLMSTWLNEVAERHQSTKLTLAGSTPSFDMSFIERHLPVVRQQLHYRLFDVSTLRQAYIWWSGCGGANQMNDLFGWTKEPVHRATQDVRYSLEVARAVQRLVSFSTS